MSEMIGQLNLVPLNIRRTNRRLTIFHKAINGHLALPIGNLQPVLRRTRHLNSKAFNTIHTGQWKFGIHYQTKIATIKEQQKFKLALKNWTKLHHAPQPWPFYSLGVLVSFFTRHDCTFMWICQLTAESIPVHWSGTSRKYRFMAWRNRVRYNSGETTVGILPARNNLGSLWTIIFFKLFTMFQLLN